MEEKKEITNFEIQIRTLCRCDNGITAHPFWHRHYEKVEAYRAENNGEFPDAYLEEKWLNDTGRDWKKTPEEIECHLCNGTGFIISYIDFADLKQMILEL